MIKRLLITLLVVSLSACVTMTEEAGTVETGNAYVFGNFTLKKGFLNGQKVALEIENMNTDETFPIELRVKDTVYPIKIPPGEYRFSRLVVTDAFKIVVDQIFLDGDFSLKEGQGLYLGDYSATLKSTFGGYKLQYVRKMDTGPETVKWIKQIDPSFENLEYFVFKQKSITMERSE